MTEERRSLSLLERTKISALVWFMALFLLVAGGVGFLVLNAHFRSRSFEPVSGVIIKSVLQPCDSEVGGFHADVRFSYTVNRRQYFAGRLRNDFGTMCEKKEIVQPLLDQYPVGKQIDAWYDPESPRMAVIDRSLGKPEKLFLVVIGGFMLFFVVVWRIQIANGRRRREVEAHQAKSGSTKE